MVVCAPPDWALWVRGEVVPLLGGVEGRPLWLRSGRRGRIACVLWGMPFVALCGGCDPAVRSWCVEGIRDMFRGKALS